MWVNDNNTLRPVDPQVRAGGSWRYCTQAFARVGGVWVQVFPAPYKWWAFFNKHHTTPANKWWDFFNRYHS